MLAEIKDATQIIFNLCGIIAFAFVAIGIFSNWKKDKEQELKNMIEEIIRESKRMTTDENEFEEFAFQDLN